MINLFLLRSRLQKIWSSEHQRKNHVIKKYVLACASIVIIATISIALFNNSLPLNDPDNSGTSVIPDVTSDNSESKLLTMDDPSSDYSTIRGLPVENFTLSDIGQESEVMDRIGFQTFSSFFKYGTTNLAVIEVTDTNTVKNDIEDDFNFLGNQISDIRVLQNVYGDNLPETLQLSQSVIKDHFCLGTTNLLRKGGVYLLPLVQSDNMWYINGDMDVLFEVDDLGKVWSHSDFDDFSQHDGQDIDAFISQLQDLTSDQDFLLANSTFAVTLENWTLADITVTEKSDILSDEYGQYFNYYFNINDIISDKVIHDENDKSWTSYNIYVYADEDDNINLIPGQRYLIFIDIYQGKIFVNHSLISKINNDLTIEALPSSENTSWLGKSIFIPYNGYSLSEIKELISRIDLWNGSHSDKP